jgi:tetratricopeptide (TPR) repeat protein
LRGDLDWITLKALEKDRERRYASASELSDDLRRYLHHEPVIASPPSALYKMRKFVRRNRIGVLASCLVICAILAGVVGLTVGMAKARDSAELARESADQARDAAQQAQAVNDFMREVLTSVSPESEGADVRLADVMDNASAVASQRFAGQPEMEAQVRLLLSTVFLQLDKGSESIGEADRAATLLESIHGRDDPRPLRARLLHLQTLVYANRTRDAEVALANLAPRVSADEADPMAMEIALFTAGVHRLRGRLDQAESILRELQQRTLLHGGQDRLHLMILNGLISVLLARQDASDPNHRELCREIEMLAQEMKDTADQRGQADSIPSVRARMLVADMMISRGEFAGAADLCREVLAISESRFGRCHIQREMAMSVLADALNRLDDSAGAAEMALQTINCAKVQNNALRLIVRIMGALPYLERSGRWAEGESIAREYRNVLEQMGGGHGDMRLYGDLFIARFVSLQERFEESGPLLQSLLTREHEADDDQTRARIYMCWGSDLARRGLYEQAEQNLLVAADRLGDVRRGTDDKTAGDLIAEFIALYRAWGKPELADEYEAMR